MKKIFHKNQIAITSLAVLIAVAGYMNFTQSDIPTISQRAQNSNRNDSGKSLQNAATNDDSGNEQYTLSNGSVGSGQDAKADGSVGSGQDAKADGSVGNGQDASQKAGTGTGDKNSQNSGTGSNGKTTSNGNSGDSKTASSATGSGNKGKTVGSTDKDSVETVGKLDISDADSLMSEKMEDPTEIEDKETIGEAVLTQAQVGEYIAGARVGREQTHSKTRETLKEIIENESLDEAARQEAIEKLTVLAETIEKEAAAEQLLDTKGYGDCLVSIGENSTDVILNYDELTQSDRAQIEDIVTRKTGCRVDQIVISRMKKKYS